MNKYELIFALLKTLRSKIYNESNAAFYRMEGNISIIEDDFEMLLEKEEFEFKLILANQPTFYCLKPKTIFHLLSVILIETKESYFEDIERCQEIDTITDKILGDLIYVQLYLQKHPGTANDYL